MTRTEVEEEYGDTADMLCKFICTECTANDWYCPTGCSTCEWIRRNYDRAIKRLAKLDGDLVEFCKRVKTWKGYR